MNGKKKELATISGKNGIRNNGARAKNRVMDLRGIIIGLIKIRTD